MAPLEVRIPHSLETDEIRRRLDQAVTVARVQYASQSGPIAAEWKGDEMHVTVSPMGMKVQASVTVQPKEVLVSVKLPLAATFFSGTIKQNIQEKLTGLLDPAGAKGLS